MTPPANNPASAPTATPDRPSSIGRLVAVCIGPGGIPKRTVERAKLTTAGLEGDRHRHPKHGGEARALCLLSAAEKQSLAEDGVVGALEPGTFGENLLIDGLDFADLRPGDRLSFARVPGAGVAGGRVVCELSDLRAPCITLESVDVRLPDLMCGRSGFVARVVEVGGTGELIAGMAVEVLGSA
ncbi:MAG: MOSC domain-containing protein [Planctomycetota bacterium]|nr:MOSC domain-containing protein [Planctomycetota bacterium]